MRLNEYWLWFVVLFWLVLYLMPERMFKHPLAIYSNF
jgi:hypothetical protein